MTLRRRRLPAELEEPYRAFADVVAIVERSKLGLTKVVPTTRLPGVPLTEALLGFEAMLREASDLMPSWRCAPTDEAWIAADEGLREALRRAERLREEAPDLGSFEELIWAVDELLAPLEGFETGVERFRSLRTKS